MSKKGSSANQSSSTRSAVHSKINAQPRLHQKAPEIQAYGTVNHNLPLDLEEPVRLEMTENLNQLLADTSTLRDLYKKSHWQVSGPTFYQLHLLFDKHFDEQVELVDAIAERIQLLGGVSLAMAGDIAETTQIERPPRGRGQDAVAPHRAELPRHHHAGRSEDRDHARTHPSPRADRHRVALRNADVRGGRADPDDRPVDGGRHRRRSAAGDELHRLPRRVPGGPRHRGDHHDRRDRR